MKCKAFHEDGTCDEFYECVINNQLEKLKYDIEFHKQIVQTKTILL